MLEALDLNRGVYVIAFNEPRSKLLVLGIMIKNSQGGAGGHAELPRDSLTKYILLVSMGLTIKLGCCVPYNSNVGLCPVDQTVPQ